MNCTPIIRTLRWNSDWKLWLERHGIFYDKTETWIESERLYEVLFSFEKEA